jgi:hypothetical protein
MITVIIRHPVEKRDPFCDRYAGGEMDPGFRRDDVEGAI